jgi:6-hydroxycyclohex-1-ene-1-carbonyl-CoA dehydrogenase
VPAVLPCGECDLCQRGLATICRSQKMPGNDIQGGFGSHIVVPARGLCRSTARLAQAGLTLAQVSIVADALTTPYQAVRRAGVEPGDLAVVVGAGGVGGYCVQVARAFGATGGGHRCRPTQAAGGHRQTVAALTSTRANTMPRR